MGEREDASVVRRMGELIEARHGDEVASRFGEDLVVYWVHTKETFLGGRNFIDMNRSYPDWDHITIDRVVAKGSVVVSEITVTPGIGVFRAASIFDIHDRKISRANEYWIEQGLEKPPVWRTPFLERSP